MRQGLQKQRIQSIGRIHVFGIASVRRHSNVTFWQARDPIINSSSTRVAVLGAGITGLTYAYLVSKIAPKAQIEVYDRSSRLGGWLQSNAVNVDGQNVIFEQGPRSLRPTLTAAGLATVDLIRDLGLQDEVLPTPKASAAARHRYVYFPDRLAHMPDPRSGILGIMRDLRQPAFEGSVLPIPMEFARQHRDSSLSDESIGSFFKRRFSEPMADNLVSAMIHGIYAGSIDQLSIKSIMPALWHQELSRGGLTGSVLKNWRSGHKWQTPQDFQLLLDLCKKQRQAAGANDSPQQDVLPQFFNSSIYTFKGGLERLSQALTDALQLAPNVTLHRNCTVTRLQLKRDTSRPTIEVSSQQSDDQIQTREFTRVASALPATALLSALGSSGIMTNQEVADLAVPSATVMVINLYYREPNLLPVQGFGYLIPRSVSTEHNPDRVLGVVFDSDATPELDGVSGTKLTVMMGGHWWNGKDTFPSEEEAIEASKALLRRHLGIRATPLATKATLQKDCIPQYVVGHQEKCQALQGFTNDRLGGLLELLGASWNGVSVNDCVKDAYLAAQRFQRGEKAVRMPLLGRPYEVSAIKEALSMPG